LRLDEKVAALEELTKAFAGEQRHTLHKLLETGSAPEDPFGRGELDREGRLLPGAAAS
jgi:hypothetical protein